ncbi:heavy metal transporter [Streptomyces europaeiscabiei]|uniref:heavy metal transporter n=1 Tax=Streptomyces europaeiscabiei TaxID=146819 RepID=UPI0029A35A72|nr:heavy metal transporter [Streptomyces europaeiscabiei]MDX3583215.1 heavy metal transporter [Streptomyces europaeiscabiei]WUD35269.1 heavy metal transporter [Streptomyces europaeiscabiei]
MSELYPFPPDPRPRRRGRRVLQFLAAFVVLAAIGAYLTVQYLTGGNGTPRCVVVSGADDGASYEFTPEQAANAATISAVGTSRELPERAVTIALATALQESGLRNIAHGDRDSLGLFQQRPSQGWGTEQQIQDPVYAAGEFYEHLAKVDDYEQLPLTVAAQRVQRSGYPEAYAKHEPDATLLAAALTGRSAATLTCEGRREATGTGAGSSTAYAGGPDAVRSALARDFGDDAFEAAGAVVGSEGGASAQASPSPSPSGSPVAGTVTIPLTDAGDAGQIRQRGWELAHWAVANSSRLGVERVTYAGREWVAEGRAGAWRKAEGTAGDSAGSATEVRIVTGQ